MSRSFLPPDTAMIGAGQLASAFLTVLAESGWPVRAVAARSQTAARRLRRRLPGVSVVRDPERAVEGCDLVLLAVPDGEIHAVAEHLAGSASRSWRRAVVLHHAGSLGPDALRPLSRAGAAVGVLHPLQALGAAGPGALEDSLARIEATGRARTMANHLARALGLRALRLRRKLRPRDRAGYHAAASLLSNDLVALWGLGTGLMESCGVDPRDAAEGLTALAEGTLRGLREGGGARGSLTGPVVRGDAEGVVRQLRRLRSEGDDAAEVHRLLSIRLARLARAEGALSKSALRDVLEALDE